MHDFFAQIGAAIGAVLRTLIELFQALFSSVGDSFKGFAGGLGDELGVGHSIFSIVIAIIGIALVIKGIRQLIGKAFIGGIIWLLIGVSLLGFVTH
ncbi:hypothetical protein [Carnimonas nigrificans]|uniref:hypothetical protein n=1 Tax=Carnimonas nigrificans TaxID=64323 RepID=UPI000471E999|nr:hypothetical protein [Carnimonas nigrificans]